MLFLSPVVCTAAQKFKPTDTSPPTFTKLLPAGTYVPMVYWSLDGLWEGQPFTLE